MVNLNYKEDGDVLFGEDLRENMSYVLVNLLNYALDGASITNQQNIVIDTDLTDEDDSNSTAFRFGDVWLPPSTGIENEVRIDDFNDGTIDTNLWTTTTSSGNNTDSTITETNNEIQLEVIDNGGNYEGANAQVTQKSGLTDVTGKTLVFEVDYSLGIGQSTQSNPFSEASIRFIDEDGNALDVFKRRTDGSGGVSDQTGAKVKIQPSSTNPETHVEVLEDTGSGFQSDGDVDISSLSPSIKIEFRLNMNTGQDSASGSFDIHYFDLDKYTDGDFVTSNNTLEDNNQVFLSTLKEDTSVDSSLRLDDNSVLAKNTDYSVDDGSSWEASDGYENIHEQSNSNNQVKARFGLNYDNSDITQMKASYINGYGFYYS